MAKITSTLFPNLFNNSTAVTSHNNGYSHYSDTIPIDGSFKGMIQSAVNNAKSPAGREAIDKNISILLGTGVRPSEFLASKLGGSGEDDSNSGYPTGGGSASFHSPSAPQQLQYIDAPYAEMYGMDASTAYQEALANTAYQRKVLDLKAAGLNPVLGYSGAGADSFYGTPNVSYSGGISYGSLGSGKSTASAAETATKLQYWLPTLVNGITNMAFTLGTKNGMTGYAAGTIAQNMVSGALGAIRNHGK